VSSLSPKCYEPSIRREAGLDRNRGRFQRPESLGRYNQKAAPGWRWNANPTGSGNAVVLDIESYHKDELRRSITKARTELLEKLAESSDEVPDHEHWREVKVWGQLLAAVDGTPVEPDAEMLEMARELMTAVDRANGYHLAWLEHETMSALVSELEAHVDPDRAQGEAGDRCVYDAA
jgi:hypothetical protein